MAAGLAPTHVFCKPVLRARVAAPLASAHAQRPDNPIPPFSDRARQKLPLTIAAVRDARSFSIILESFQRSLFYPDCIALQPRFRFVTQEFDFEPPHNF